MYFFWILSLAWSHLSFCQYAQQKLFPSDSGYLLLQKLVTAYKPNTVLDYAAARVKMYTEIYNRQDTVECVYTKHALYLDPVSSDPIGYLAKNGNDNGINCEHSFPQSKGAENGNAKSDMHHLFPSRAAVNEARSNYPFGEIDDTKTNRWFYKSFSQNFIPGSNKNEFSESITGMFEPREDHKGNVARALFYFFCMYELQADALFFESMKTVLCSWHLQDPVDSLEWERSHIIAKYQDQKPNPFVLDCSLPKRCYCAQNADCQVLSKTDEETLKGIHIFPNPFSEFLFLDRSNLAESPIRVQLFDLYGRLHWDHAILPDKKSQVEIPVIDLPPGNYKLVLHTPTFATKRIHLIKL